MNLTPCILIPGLIILIILMLVLWSAFLLSGDISREEERRKPVHYTSFLDISDAPGANGWAPGYEPLLDIEKEIAAKAADLGYWQDSGGWIYSPDPDGDKFIDWRWLRDVFAEQDAEMDADLNAAAMQMMSGED